MFASMCNLISDEAGRRPISFKNDGKRQNKPVLGGDFQVFFRNQKGDVGKQALLNGLKKAQTGWAFQA
ncbi:hypothetical protein [Pseudomonas bubulae]|uniref:hypothetical protein n=1 Tax=Pseudomonas bubulae TaxID=2316085 RepID=UPI001030A928|nr:hypothetical protein [Pseudomonas bubulae]